MFQSWLSIHREAIKTINIGYLSRDGGSNKHIFDATLFPNLESLRLSRWQMGPSGALLPFSAENACLLGPKLKLFGWSFVINDQHSESWNDFGVKEEEWIRELGNAAIARKAALKMIEIQFWPDYWYETGGEEYPWDRMNHVRDGLLRPNGIDLCYNTPVISRENWLLGRERASKQPPSDEIESENETETKTEEVETRPTTPPGYYGRDIREYFVSI